MRPSTNALRLLLAQGAGLRQPQGASLRLPQGAGLRLPQGAGLRPRGAALLACAALLLSGGFAPGAAHAQQQIGAETRPEPIPDPDANPNVKKPVPRAQKVELKRTGKVVYKCGEEYTDQPVCQDHTKAARIKLSPEDEKRCDDFKKNNFIPWYCRK